MTTPITVEKSASPIGARLSGVDLAAGLDEAAMATVARAIYDNSVLAISGQDLDAPGLERFASRLGPLHRNPTSPYCDPAQPEIMILTNRRKDGKQLGAVDAGQSWHTDMAYNAIPGRLTVLFAREVPVRDGVVLGDTQFSDMYAVYEALPADIKRDIDHAEGLHDFHKYYDEARRNGSPRPPLTPEQRAKRPPVPHPMVGRHPVTGRKFLYANPGYIVEVIGLAPERSREIVDFLCDFQVRPEFMFRHKWRLGDVLIWDNLSTIHKATADYRPDEPRYMLRAQVTATGGFPAAHTIS